MSGTASSTAALNLLLEKTSDWDKDERYMATNDLCNELTNDVKIDETMERRICAAVLKQLDDQSNDVQSVAVKCLAIILKKVHQTQVGEICDKLCALILEGKDALRDIYSIGLKTLIADVPDEMGLLVSERVASRLLNGITRTGSDDIKRECLDNMADLLRRFGHLIAKDHDDIMSAVVRQLYNEKASLRKRAAVCLGSLAVVSSDSLLNKLVELILGQIEAAELKSKSSADARTLIQTVGTISRTVGYRLGRHLDRLVPLFLRFCGSADDEGLQNEAADELREHCLPGLESFILRCPREVTPYVSSILTVALGFMKYDPNYSYDEEEEEASDNEEEEEEEEEEDFGSDDDDNSWKVRKAAVRVVTASIAARPELIREILSTCALQLIGRFREREENVRLDVFTCFTTLLQASTTSTATRISGKRFSQSRGMDSGPVIPDIVPDGPVHFIRSISPAIVSAAMKQLKKPTGNVATKSAVYTMFRSLVLATHGGLESMMPLMVNSVEKCVLDKHQALKLDALLFLRQALESHPPKSLQPSLSRLLPLVTATVQEDWFKIIAESLRVLRVMIQVARPMLSKGDAANTQILGGEKGEKVREGEKEVEYDFVPLVRPIYNALIPRLESLDIDQEIKECSISTVGMLFAVFGDQLRDELPGVLTLLKKRLVNELTRLPTLKALATMAGSTLHLDLSPVLTDCTVELSQFLRQQSRGLRLSALVTISALVDSPCATLTDENVTIIVTEITGLINDSDLHLTHLTLLLVKSVLNKSPYSGCIIKSQVYTKMIDLSGSSLLHGAALQSLISLFQEFVTAIVDGLTYRNILDALYERSSTTGELMRQSVSNVAKCVAGICATISEKEREEMVCLFSQDLQGENEKRKHLSLLCVGEIGQQTTLGMSDPSSLKDLIMACFDSKLEGSKIAAAYALGCLAVGNMSTYLPVILTSIENTKHQYLLLAALKEIIVVHAIKGMDFSAYLNAVLPCLLAGCKVEEEGVRGAVAECLGVLTSMHGESLVPILLNLSRDVDDKLTRRTISTALRFALSRHPAPSLDIIQGSMEEFLRLLSDVDLEVRKSVLLMVNAATHHFPQVIAPFLRSQVMESLYETLTFKQERTVDLGPFKHKVDDGLPLRKAALTCVETVLDMLQEYVQAEEFLPRLLALLSDKDELKLQAHSVLCRLCNIYPAAVLGFVDSLIEPIEKVVSKKINKDGVIGPEAERAVELVRSGLKAVLEISRLEDISLNRKWSEMTDRLTNPSSSTAEILASLTLAYDRGVDM